MLLTLRAAWSQVARIEQFLLCVISTDKSKSPRISELGRLAAHLQEIQLLCINVSLYLPRSEIYFIWCRRIHDLHDVEGLQSFVPVIESCGNSITANGRSPDIRSLDVSTFEGGCFPSRRWRLPEFDVIHHSISTRIKMADCLKEGGGEGGLSKRWTPDFIQEPLLISLGILLFHQPSNRQWLRRWPIARHPTSMLHCMKVPPRCYPWLARQLRPFSAPPAEGIDWYGPIIPPSEPASPGHSSEPRWSPSLVVHQDARMVQLLLFMSSTWFYFNLLRAIREFGPYQSHSFLSLSYFRSPLGNREAAKWQGALTRRKNRRKSHTERSAVSGNERSRKSADPQSPRNEKDGVLGLRRIHGVQICRPPSSHDAWTQAIPA